jgi:hypothetical protein
VAIDQLRTIDVERVVRRLGHIHPNTLLVVLRVLQECFLSEIIVSDSDAACPGLVQITEFEL